MFWLRFSIKSIVRNVCVQSCLILVTPWTVACQAPLSMRFSRQAYWNGLPFPSPGALPDLGIKPGSPAWQANSLPTELSEKVYLIDVIHTGFPSIDILAEVW